MQVGRLLLGAAVAAAAATAAPAAAAECAPARIVQPEGMAMLPQPWRQAVEALVAATAREGQPWSCPDARVTLIPAGDHGLAQLEVEDASGVRRRPVASPDDVVPLGEAMLARAVSDDGEPAPKAVPPPPPPASLSQRNDPLPPAPAAEPSRGRRVLVDLLAGTRYTGPTRALVVGPELRATMGFDRWQAGLVARYDAAIAVFQTVPDQFTLSSVSVGLTGGYRLLTSPVELTASVEPTLAVVFMGGQRPEEPEPDVDAHVDMRLGARLGAAVPITERIRFACALGGEGAPAALFTDRSSRRHALPSLPGYLVGLSVGMEVLAIR